MKWTMLAVCLFLVIFVTSKAKNLYDIYQRKSPGDLINGDLAAIAKLAATEPCLNNLIPENSEIFLFRCGTKGLARKSRKLRIKRLGIAQGF